MERVMGIEPTSQAWEAHVLPLYDTRIWNAVILTKGSGEGNRLPTSHFSQFTHTLGNIGLLDLGRFL